MQTKQEQCAFCGLQGGRMPGVVQLVAREFVVLVAMAAVLAWPLAYLGMTRWLEDFAYRIDLGVGAFLWTTLAALGITLLTISYPFVHHVLRLANPPNQFGGSGLLHCLKFCWKDTCRVLLTIAH